MSRRRRRHQTEKPRRPVDPEVAAFAELAVVRQATRVKRLAYTRTQAAEALGISTSTFERRILPFIETVQMDWGKLFSPGQYRRFRPSAASGNPRVVLPHTALTQPLSARGRQPSTTVLHLRVPGTDATSVAARASERNSLTKDRV
jgi:hypothetical protein